VVPSVSAYRSTRLAYDAPNAPTGYDPFQAGATTARIAFTVRNTGRKRCNTAFAFFKLGAFEAKAGAASLAYRILGDSGPIGRSAATPPSRLDAGGASRITIGEGQTVEASATLSVSDGQIVGPGLFTDQLLLVLFCADDSGGFVRGLEAVPLDILIKVNPVVTLSIAGGGQKTTVNFGELAEGAKRSVQLLAYANQRFHLTLSSENQGMLKPVEKTALAEGWSVPYRVSIMTTGLIDLGQRRALSLWPHATTKSGVAIPVDVEIGSIKAQRAGLYRDVITIAIDPGP
jgi:hypothetical protein